MDTSQFGSFVVLGGIHPSMLFQEALLHADAIVIGEAEETWPQLINDFRERKVHKIYNSIKRIEGDRLVIPRWDLLKYKSYNSFLVQTTRGCPFDCDFCSVRAFSGASRHKPVENVLIEIEALRKIANSNFITFSDDNIFSDNNYAKELFKTLKPLKIKWASQASINIAKDPELLALAKESGCVYLLIGFESVSQASLNSVNKGYLNKYEYYKDAIERIYSHGLAILGTFILGFDGDDESIFERTLEFINETNISFPIFNILTPLPGTKLYFKMEEEGRIIHKRWNEYNGANVCIKPKMMPAEMLKEGYYWISREAYSYKTSFERLERLWKKGVWKQNNAPNMIKAYLTMKLIKNIAEQKHHMIPFILRSLRELWLNKNINIGALLFNLNFHEYGNNLPYIKSIKRG